MSDRTHLEQQDVSTELVQALFRYPQTLIRILQEAQLPPHRVAMWARREGCTEIEKLAGWLAVGQRPNHYKPLLEVAASHLRNGDLAEALPVFRWAYHTWLLTPGDRQAHQRDGGKLLALWGQCLHRLGRTEEARTRWLLALETVPDEEALRRLIRVIEPTASEQDQVAVLTRALEQDIPGARALWERQQRLQANATEPTRAIAPPTPGNQGTGIAVMADVANLDMVCGDQFGYNRLLDYGRLLQEASRRGSVRTKIAFVPDVPETLPIRQHLVQAGFQIDLKRPKRSHGRWVANADTAMAAEAVRWASDPKIGRVELWTGDGDFCVVREVIHESWPHVAVAFRSFAQGTAAAIRRLEDDWEPIEGQYLQPVEAPARQAA